MTPQILVESITYCVFWNPCIEVRGIRKNNIGTGIRGDMLFYLDF